MNKINCYNCKWAHDIAGSAHKKCMHPKSGISDNPFLVMASLLGGGVPIKTGLKVKRNSQGIKGGWANHPLNFDPIWIEDCDGFTPQREKGRE